MPVELPEIPQDARRLTQAVIQVVDMLDLYQAEMARILHLQCADIGRLANGQSLLEPGSEAWKIAQAFVRFYQLLYQQQNADGVAMRHWIRRKHPVFEQTPHLMLVDEDKLVTLVNYLQKTSD